MPSPVLRSDAGRVRTLTLNRPEARNAIDPGLLAALQAELAAAHSEDVGCVVLAGAGQAFSAGGDIHQMRALQQDPTQAIPILRRALAATVEALRASDAPVLAKVHGDCVGAGLGLALACDLVYASEAARFGAPFAALGLVPDTALTHELPRRIGMHRAKELALTSKLLDARTALAWGLVNEVAAPEGLDAAVGQVATRLAAMPTRALGEAKRALHRGAEAGVAAALAGEAYTQAVRFASPEHAAGVEAFLKKGQNR